MNQIIDLTNDDISNDNNQSNDDSLLRPLLINKNNDKLESKSKFNAIIDCIELSNDNNDDDSSDIEIIEEKLNDNHIDYDDDKDNQIHQSSFTCIKDRNGENDDNNFRFEGEDLSDNNEEWIELDEDNRCHSTPVIHTHTRIHNRLSKNHKSSTAVKSGKKALLKSKRLKKHSDNNNRLINKNLFDDNDPDIEQNDQQTEHPADKIRQNNILNYISIIFDKNLHDLATNEFETLIKSKNLNFEINEQCDSDLCCVTWKCHPELSKLIENNTNTSAFKLIKILKNFLFDHLLLLIDCDRLHKYLDVYLDDQRQTNELFESIKKCCERFNIFNVTVIVYQLEKHLRAQQKIFDDSFKRKIINDLNVNDHDDDDDNLLPQIPVARNNKRKWPYRTTMNYDNLDSILIDCKMTFLHQFNTKLSFKILNTKEELSNSIFQYTRSLAEQYFRYNKSNNSMNLNYFALSDSKHLTIDPLVDGKKLWLQQLLQFPNLNYELAEMLVEKFANPFKLYQQLINQQSSSKAIEWLSNLSTNNTNNNRRIGHELATKIYKFFTTKNPNEILKS